MYKVFLIVKSFSQVYNHFDRKLWQNIPQCPLKIALIDGWTKGTETKRLENHTKTINKPFETRQIIGLLMRKVKFLSIFTWYLWRFQIFKINSSILCFSVIEKWLKDGLRKLDDGTFKSRVHPFIRQWGTAHWSLSTEEAYELTKNFDSDLMYLKVSLKRKILIKTFFLLVWS